MASVVSEITWLIVLFKELDMPLSSLVIIHCDSIAAIQIASNPIFMNMPSILALIVILLGKKSKIVLCPFTIYPLLTNLLIC